MMTHRTFVFMEQELEKARAFKCLGLVYWWDVFIQYASWCYQMILLTMDHHMLLFVFDQLRERSNNPRDARVFQRRSNEKRFSGSAENDRSFAKSYLNAAMNIYRNIGMVIVTKLGRFCELFTNCCPFFLGRFPQVRQDLDFIILSDDQSKARARASTTKWSSRSCNIASFMQYLFGR